MLSDASEVSAGVTKGVLGWTEDKIKQIIKKFKNKDLAFLDGDPEIIDIAKEQRKHGEYAFFEKFVKDKDYRILIQMGLTLRKKEKTEKELSSIKGRILDKYGSEGLHIAQFVQESLLPKYFSSVMETRTQFNFTMEIENLFKNIDKVIVFIQASDNIDKKAKEIITKIYANSPMTFIIASSKSAMKVCEKVKDKVISEILDYALESYESESRNIYFLNKKEFICRKTN